LFKEQCKPLYIVISDKLLTTDSISLYCDSNSIWLCIYVYICAGFWSGMMRHVI